MPTKTRPSHYYARRAVRSWFTGQVVPPFGFSIDQAQLNDTVTYGDNHPGWASRIRSHVSATTALEGVSYRSNAPEAHDGYSSIKLVNSNNGSEVNAEIRGCLHYLELATISDPSANFIASVKNKVIQDTNSKVRQAHKSLQGLVSLGEMGQSVRMVNRMGRDIFGKTQSYLRDLNKIAGRLTPQNIMRTVNERWLEYRFGVRPLVSDIGGFIDACYQNRYGRPPRVLIRSSATSMEKNPPTRGSFGVHWHLIESSVEKQKIYGYKLYGCIGLDDLGSPPPFRQEFGLTLDEFVPTLWELIPYSFLVDYVSNIGAIIDAYSLNKSSIRWLAFGELKENKTIVSSTHSPSHDPIYKLTSRIAHPCTPLWRSYRRVQRGVASPSSHLIPSLEFRVPGSSTQWLNIGALAGLHADTSHRLRQGYRF